MICVTVDVAVGPVTRTNCQVIAGDVVCMSKLQCPVLPADYVHLVSLSVILIIDVVHYTPVTTSAICRAETEVPREKVFSDYTKHHLGN